MFKRNGKLCFYFQFITGLLSTNLQVNELQSFFREVHITFFFGINKNWAFEEIGTNNDIWFLRFDTSTEELIKDFVYYYY